MVWEWDKKIQESHHQLLSLQFPEDLCVKVRSKVLKIKEFPSLLFSCDKLGLLWAMIMYGSTANNTGVWYNTFQTLGCVRPRGYLLDQLASYWELPPTDECEGWCLAGGHSSTIGELTAQVRNPGFNFWLASFPDYSQILSCSSQLQYKISLGTRLISGNCQL